MQVAWPDLAPFRAWMEPANQHTAAVPEANVKKYQNMVEQYRKA